MQLLECRGGCSGQKHSFVVVDTLHLDTKRAVPPSISLVQSVQKALVVAPMGVVSNAALRRIAPRLPSINILFFTCGPLFLLNHLDKYEKALQNWLR
jgi:hypothetical protein